MNTTNYRHAAVVLKSLPKKTANQFLANLDPLQSQKIVMEMRHTHVSAASLREAIAKLKADGLGANEGLGSNDGLGYSNSETFSSEAKVFQIDSADPGANFGNKVGLAPRPNLDFSSSGTVSFEKKPFVFLTSYETTLLDPLFADLKVRSAAIILSMMSFEFALQRLNTMEGDRKVQVMRGIADLEDLHPAEVSDLKFAVRLQIQQMLKMNPKLNQQPVVAAKRQTLPTSSIRIESGKSRQLSLLENGKLISGLLDMPDTKVRKLLKTINTADLAPALKTCPIKVQKKVLKNMAKKPAAILSNEILKVRIDEKHRITKARRGIAKAIERLKN